MGFTHHAKMRLLKHSVPYFIFSALLALVHSSNCVAATVSVCPDCEIKSIKRALLESKPNDQILVGPGIYSEGEIRIDHSIKISAQDPNHPPTIDGEGQKNVFLIHASHVTLEGLVIQHSGQSYTEEFAGIKIEKTSHCTLTNNQLAHNNYGIYLADVQTCTITQNQIVGDTTSTIVSEASIGNGIHLWNSKEVFLQDNLTTHHRDGIYFEFVQNSQIIGNKSKNNLRYGLHFMYSHHNHYEGNLFSNNGSGVAVMYSKNILMKGNTFEENKGAASYGLLLKDISNSEIRGNSFTENTVGIFLEGTTRSLFVGNLFKNNGWALRVLGNTDSNHFISNDFLENTFDLSTNATQNLNTFTGNYWSRYTGIDFDRDGKGDQPYHPVQLSSLLMEKFPASILLVRSFFFQILDHAEKLFPILTPESYQDVSPQSNRNTQL